MTGVLGYDFVAKFELPNVDPGTNAHITAAEQLGQYGLRTEYGSILYGN